MPVPSSHPLPRALRCLPALALTAAAVAGAGEAGASSSAAGPSITGAHVCPPDTLAFGYSDALDGATRGGATVGGLSDLAWDARSRAWVSSVDNNADDPARLWFFRSLSKPSLTRDALVLKHPDGTPYTGRTGDFEGMAVLRNGDYVISSEVEPSVRIFGRDGVEKAHLAVPARFGVTGKSAGGEATNNATFEGLTLSADGRTLVVAMEGALSGDSSDTDKNEHRLLVYRKQGAQWALTKQVAYRTETGNRIPEVAFYGRDNLVVEEAAFSPTTGNTVQLFAVTHLTRAKDVTNVADLSNAPQPAVKKKLVADVSGCPNLGAKAKPAAKQANPLMDNYEGMAVTTPGLFGRYGISLISDNNFNTTQQTTRVLDLVVHLPN